MHFETVKEAFHDNNASAVLVGEDTMKIEEDQRLAESRWKSVPWLCVVQDPSCIGKQFALGIMNRDNHTSPHDALPSIEANAKELRRDPIDRASAKVIVSRIDWPELKAQWLRRLGILLDQWRA
jgi:hypothetical protein